MGTRSLTFVHDEEDQILMVMYRQFDGYLEGMGRDLYKFLHGIRMINGISMNDDTGTANGFGCLAAQIVAHFKKGVGGFYLNAPRKLMDAGQEYEYHIYPQPNGMEICIKVIVPGFTAKNYKRSASKDVVLFDGSISDFENFLNREAVRE